MAGGKGKAPAKVPLRRSTRIRKPVQNLGAATASPAKNKGKGPGRPRKDQTTQTKGRKRRRAGGQAGGDGDGEEEEEEREEEERPAKRGAAAVIVNNYNSGPLMPSAHQRRGKNAKVYYWIQKNRWPRKQSSGSGGKPKGGGYLQSEDEDDDDDYDFNDGNRASSSQDDSGRSKWTPYLQSKSSYGYESWNGLHAEERKRLQDLAARNCQTPTGTVFDTNNTMQYLDKMRSYGTHTGLAALVFPLIVPFAGVEALRGGLPMSHLPDMIEEPWDASASLDIELARYYRIPEPTPYYTVGFPRRSALSAQQSERLEQHLSFNGDTNFFQASSDVIFPFLTAEGKDSDGSLNEADKQNLHYMTLAMRAVVELFKLVGREEELDSRILGFSISFDYTTVRIYAHYPIVRKSASGETNVEFYRHEVNAFSITAQNGKERWTCYRFVMAIYNDWVPHHFQRICSAIDQLPELRLTVSENSEESTDSEDEGGAGNGEDDGGD